MMTDKQVIALLGGARVVAEQLTAATGQTIKANAIGQWTFREEIPARWRVGIARLAKNADLDLPDDFLTRGMRS